MKQDTGSNAKSKLAAQQPTGTHEMDTLDSKCYFVKLPAELRTEILSYFPRWQLLKISTTCKDFRSTCLRHYIKEVHIRTSNRGGCLKLLERYPEFRLAVRYLKVDIFKSGKDKWARAKLWDPIDYYDTDDEDSSDLTLEDGIVADIPSEGTTITFEGRRVKLRRPQKPFNHRKVLGEIQFPKGLEYIGYHPKSCVPRFRTLDILKASFNTLTTLEIPGMALFRTQAYPWPSLSDFEGAEVGEAPARFSGC
ncbi:hypothetical protein TWF191_004680 [Orbilia oligospora]|uniref:F-box domain-containing protein n=1 Tax=Orbilia oligospora TaxID=2813651 RepID=A0A7C8QYP2_ORBOL|nr:hypothetical protein TWF191_004680 [Orbilia oligospora]